MSERARSNAKNCSRLDDPLDRRRADLVRSVRLPDQQPSRSDPIVRRPAALRRQGPLAGSGRVGACESTEDGQTCVGWPRFPRAPAIMRRKIITNCTRSRPPDGRIIVHIRNHNKKNKGETLQTESTDEGKTWSTPHSIGVWGVPSHLLRLKDDRLLMTYGHRRKTVRQSGKSERRQCRTWSEPITISGDGYGFDLGLSLHVQLSDVRCSPYGTKKCTRAIPRGPPQAHWSLK